MGARSAASWLGAGRPIASPPPWRHDSRPRQFTLLQFLAAKNGRQKILPRPHFPNLASAPAMSSKTLERGIAPNAPMTPRSYRRTHTTRRGPAAKTAGLRRMIVQDSSFVPANHPSIQHLPPHLMRQVQTRCVRQHSGTPPRGSTPAGNCASCSAESGRVRRRSSPNPTEQQLRLVDDARTNRHALAFNHLRKVGPDRLHDASTQSDSFSKVVPRVFGALWPFPHCRRNRRT